MIPILPSLLLSAALLPTAPLDGTTGLAPKATLEALTGDPDASFAESVALDGDVALIGSPLGGGDLQDAGAAYVYVQAAGLWSQEARLLPTDTRSGDQFGRSVAIQGDFAFVGADNFLTSGGFINGAVYVFERQGGLWPQVALIEPSDGAFADGFGAQIAVSGTTLLVGAAGAGTTGKAYVFVGGGATWTEEAKLIPGTGGGSGTRVALDGDVALVTSPLNASTRGAATIFTRTGTSWAETKVLKDTNRASGERFGSSAALSGDLAAVGSRQLDGSFGGVLIFERLAGVWSMQQKLALSSSVFASGFGQALAWQGDTLLVGTPDDNALGSNQGAVYTFDHPDSKWSQAQQLLPGTSPDIGDSFGLALAASGDRVLVGDIQSYDEPGAGTVFDTEVLAQVLSRTAGANVASLSAAAPILNSTWTASVDLSTTGHTDAYLGLSLFPANVILGNGQALLLGTLLMPLVGAIPGPSANFALPIPNDVSLVGLQVSTQAVHLGGITPYALSNAQDLCVGF